MGRGRSSERDTRIERGTERIIMIVEPEVSQRERDKSEIRERLFSSIDGHGRRSWMSVIMERVRKRRLLERVRVGLLATVMHAEDPTQCEHGYSQVDVLLPMGSWNM